MYQYIHRKTQLVISPVGRTPSLEGDAPAGLPTLLLMM